MEKILKSIQESLTRIARQNNVNPGEMIGVLAELDKDLKEIADRGELDCGR
jgi:chorismate mutase